MPEDLIFRSFAPRGPGAPLVANSPHSGRVYPPCFLSASRLRLAQLRPLEDFCVDALIASAPDAGAFLLTARFPRLWLDVNRAPYELDRALFSGPLPAFTDSNSHRAAAGSGTFARLAGQAGAIYHQPLGWEEAHARLTQAYFPYHAELARLIEEASKLHRARPSQVPSQVMGQALLLDFHSMPSSAAPEHDIVIGDLHGRAAGPGLREAAQNWLETAGLRVACNTPYAGGHITAHYGKPEQGRHVMQIEINRALYMDEAACICHRPAFSQLREKMTGFLTHMAEAAENAPG